MRREFSSRRERLEREERECPYRGSLPLPPASDSRADADLSCGVR